MEHLYYLQDEFGKTVELPETTIQRMRHVGWIEYKRTYADANAMNHYFKFTEKAR